MVADSPEGVGGSSGGVLASHNPAAVEDNVAVEGCLSVGRPVVDRPVEGGKSAAVGSSEVEDLPASVLADAVASTAPEGSTVCQHTQPHLG